MGGMSRLVSRPGEATGRASFEYLIGIISLFILNSLAPIITGAEFK
jgi:hypothetical protein